jgi:hypothetical protein
MHAPFVEGTTTMYKVLAATALMAALTGCHQHSKAAVPKECVAYECTHDTGGKFGVYPYGVDAPAGQVCNRVALNKTVCTPQPNGATN